MQNLIQGVHRFQRHEFGKYRELFQRLSREGQKPHTLFITCADSRVVAEIITQSKPGDLFVIKNVGNIVPQAGPRGVVNSTGAAIEFAVSALEVSDIVVCGHTQCGAMMALVDGVPAQKQMPHLCDWLEIAAPVRNIIQEKYANLASLDKHTAAAEENVLFALDNLHTYPIVQERLAAGKLAIHGWMFEIATARLFAFEPSLNHFVPLDAGSGKNGPKSDKLPGQ
ncbi:MAG: carbonic anhydrase [Verrucomicrobiota bacterium]|nr:carbonic anhydrase [Verrucomicrobiota bacterium]